jgi:hypothetical protein
MTRVVPDIAGGSELSSEEVHLMRIAQRIKHRKCSFADTLIASQASKAALRLAFHDS